MELNNSMRALLEEHSISLNDFVSENHTYPIWCKTDAEGRSYWGFSSFHGLDKHPPCSSIDLSQLEWDGNEVYIEAQTNSEIENILRQAIEIVVFWRNELETKYPETPFYIFASYDNGDILILDEDELPTQSVTLRFWAYRGNNTVTNLEHFESWEQPAIIEYCNFAPQKPDLHTPAC